MTCLGWIILADGEDALTVLCSERPPRAVAANELAAVNREGGYVWLSASLSEGVRRAEIIRVASDVGGVFRA